MDIGPFEWSFIGAVSEEIADEETRLNKNDSLHNKNEYNYDGYTVYDMPLKDTEDQISKLETMATLSLLEEQFSNDDSTDIPDKQEFISLKEVNTLVNKKRKLPLRPFEKYIQDLVSGKKTLDDGLD